MKKYEQPMTEKVELDFSAQLLAGSVRNDDQTILNGSTDYDDNPEDDGSDAGAKLNPFVGEWDD